jgi:5-methyltetrahydrofolate--homocysteine methyltransferase
MLSTAYTSSAIAMGAAGAAILFSSRSIILTLFSTLAVGYVLTSVTATLVALGWTLGFLEAILFAILIGISCDFIIHFSHAYAHAEGKVDRHTRTKFALLSMGPSILAAALTTFFAATCMMFTVITFFTKFGVVLFLTILQAVVGSFAVFLTITDTLGPSHPTFLYETMVAKWTKWRRDGANVEEA